MHEDLTVPIQSDHPLHVNTGIGKRIGPEQDPSENENENGIDMTAEPSEKAEFLLVETGDFFEDDEQSVPEPPDDEIPAGAVPDAGRHEDDEKIEEIASF